MPTYRCPRCGKIKDLSRGNYICSECNVPMELEEIYFGIPTPLNTFLKRPPPSPPAYQPVVSEPTAYEKSRTELQRSNLVEPTLIEVLQYYVFQGQSRLEPYSSIAGRRWRDRENRLIESGFLKQVPYRKWSYEPSVWGRSALRDLGILPKDTRNPFFKPTYERAQRISKAWTKGL